MKEIGIGIIYVSIGIALALGVIGGGWYAWKTVQVWGAEMSGRAILAEAEFSKQARVKEAQAKRDAAALEGEAELTRAEFAAKSNAALADGLGGPEAYLRYLYIRMLEEQGAAGQVIYIPTEAGIPLLEAGKR
ncbi:hypothetical protein [Roseibium sp. Sym1]|uniref:hypothetical protein n=1 Tax=Roseibium sp. Sym1 TaxID=3016006 RepID=UPI0022B3FE5D|nr:hypothetical protein [Roseibium sp. Sym1]